MGKSGRRPDHIEEALHRAARSARDVSHLQQSCGVLVRLSTFVSINVGQNREKFVWEVLCIVRRQFCYYTDYIPIRKPASEATLKVPISNVCCLMKDMEIETRRTRKRNASAKRRQFLRMAKGRKAPAKKSKLAAPTPSRFQMWPALLPYDVCKAIKSVGLVEELCLASKYHSN